MFLRFNVNLTRIFFYLNYNIYRFFQRDSYKIFIFFNFKRFLKRGFKPL